jgi:hypothetical protein
MIQEGYEKVSVFFLSVIVHSLILILANYAQYQILKIPRFFSWLVLVSGRYSEGYG